MSPDVKTAYELFLGGWKTTTKNNKRIWERWSNGRFVSHGEWNTERYDVDAFLEPYMCNK